MDDRWQQLERDQVRAGDALDELKGSPTSVALERTRAVFARYLETERSVLDELAHEDMPVALDRRLEEQHSLLAAGFNSVLWERPGTVELQRSAERLRERLVEQTALVDESKGSGPLSRAV